MEYFEGGSMLDLMKKKGPCNEKYIAVVIKQIIKAIIFLHSKQKLHRGIKGKRELFYF